MNFEFEILPIVAVGIFFQNYSRDFEIGIFILCFGFCVRIKKP